MTEELITQIPRDDAVGAARLIAALALEFGGRAPEELSIWATTHLREVIRAALASVRGATEILLTGELRSGQSQSLLANLPDEVAVISMQRRSADVTVSYRLRLRHAPTERETFELAAMSLGSRATGLLDELGIVAARLGLSDVRVRRFATRGSLTAEVMPAQLPALDEALCVLVDAPRVTTTWRMSQGAFLVGSDLVLLRSCEPDLLTPMETLPLHVPQRYGLGGPTARRGDVVPEALEALIGLFMENRESAELWVKATDLRFRRAGSNGRCGSWRSSIELGVRRAATTVELVLGDGCDAVSRKELARSFRRACAVTE